jgi:adenylate cyclase
VKLGPTVIAPFHGDQGPYVSADDAGYQFLLDYRWGERPIDTYGLASLLAGEIDASRLRDRIIVVGTAAPSVKDSFFTPLSRAGAPSDRAMYGAEVHAHAAHQLLRYATGESRPLTSLSSLAVASWVALWCLAGAAVGSWNRRLSLLIAALAAGVVVLVALTVVFFDRAVWIPFMPAFLGLLGSTAGVVAAGSVLERADRRELLGLFSRFQGQNVADEIWRRRDEFVGEGGRPTTRRMVLTTLLADLEGYTGVSEQLEPETLIDWVNDYLSAMAEIVEAHGGVVDDYAGDGIKASFGFPIPRDREEQVDADAEAAVRCALAIGRRIEELNVRLGEQGLPVSRCRIGVFTGPVVAGFIGSDRALKYASVGDAINTAKRLEEFHKQDFHAEQEETSWRVLIGDETMNRAGEHFVAVSIGTHRVRGKADPIEIFRIVDER